MGAPPLTWKEKVALKTRGIHPTGRFRAGVVPKTPNRLCDQGFHVWEHVVSIYTWARLCNWCGTYQHSGIDDD